ncbi:MAG TPA: FKBP-type peptidyl-prolyl cis-trans isomerase [Pyrinomonadaceae bacterium]|nr:FKBP-type peptidyl-prolyl cis-trans isomerase [Pyrinomonadaceae bacterium]
MKMRKGIDILSEDSGVGDDVERGKWYEISLRMWLKRGDPILWVRPFGISNGRRVEDSQRLLTTRVRFHREYLFSGLFYGMEGMKVGGTRKLKIAPHLAYGAEGVNEMIPPNALLIVEVTLNKVLETWSD